MKIIAFIPAKNEEAFLPFCIESLQTWVDEVIVYDDHSTDQTRAIVEKYGCLVITESYKTESGWPEYEIRERLLAEGRKRGGTHFVGIDADEIFTPAFTDQARAILLQMQPGDSLSLRWITLWKNNTQERIDGGYKNLSKQFIFCDDGISHHQYAFLGVGRVPINPTGKIISVDKDLGGLLHYQYVLWDRTQIKQAWYRCSELLKRDRSAQRINNMYATSLDGTHVKTATLPDKWISHITSRTIEIQQTWQYKQIVEWFNEHGVEFFEPLQIWHIPELHKIFLEQTGREPKIEVFPDWLIRLNKLRHEALSHLRRITT